MNIANRVEGKRVSLEITYQCNISFNVQRKKPFRNWKLVLKNHSYFIYNQIELFYYKNRYNLCKNRYNLKKFKEMVRVKEANMRTLFTRIQMQMMPTLRPISRPIMVC